MQIVGHMGFWLMRQFVLSREELVKASLCLPESFWLVFLLSEIDLSKQSSPTSGYADVVCPK